MERSFADAKQLHGHRYARQRGLRKVMEQSLSAATAQNMKKIALLLAQLSAYFCAMRAPYVERIAAWIMVLHALLRTSSNQHVPA